MAIFYKDSGFYFDDFGGFVPEGAVEITEKEYLALLEGQANGMLIIEQNGKPVLVEQALEIDLNSAKRDEINRKRDEVCFGGIYIESMDKWFDTDETSFVKMIGAKSVMDNDFLNGQEVQPELWICADNSVVLLNRDDLALIIRSIKQNVSNMHSVALQHKAFLEQSDNPSEYDFSSGWSKTYQDFLEEQHYG